MATRNPRRKIVSALDAFDALGGTGDPLARLDAARRVREAAEELEATQVRAARTAGLTWAVIGACYGLTKQGAQQRFRHTDEMTAADLPSTRTKGTHPGA